MPPSPLPPQCGAHPRRGRRLLAAVAIAAVASLAAAACGTGSSGSRAGGSAGGGGGRCATEGAAAVDRSATTLELPTGVELEQHVVFNHLPCGWLQTEHGLAVRGATGGFAPNINVLHRRLAARGNVRTFALANRAQFEALGRQPGSSYHQLRFGAATVFAGQAGYEFAFRRSAQGLDLVQVQDYLVRGRDAWSATLSATAPQYEHGEAEMLAVLRSARLRR